MIFFLGIGFYFLSNLLASFMEPTYRLHHWISRPGNLLLLAECAIIYGLSRLSWRLENSSALRALDLEALVLRCVEKDPAARPADASSLSRSLEACRSAGDWSDKEACAWWEGFREKEGGPPTSPAPTALLRPPPTREARPGPARAGRSSP